jgi:hypothetical protein
MKKRPNSPNSSATATGPSSLPKKKPKIYDELGDPDARIRRGQALMSDPDPAPVEVHTLPVKTRLSPSSSPPPLLPPCPPHSKSGVIVPDDDDDLTLPAPGPPSSSRAASMVPGSFAVLKSPRSALVPATASQEEKRILPKRTVPLSDITPISAPSVTTSMSTRMDPQRRLPFSSSVRNHPFPFRTEAAASASAQPMKKEKDACAQAGRSTTFKGKEKAVADVLQTQTTYVKVKSQTKVERLTADLDEVINITDSEDELDSLRDRQPQPPTYTSTSTVASTSDRTLTAHVTQTMTRKAEANTAMTSTSIALKRSLSPVTPPPFVSTSSSSEGKAKAPAIPRSSTTTTTSLTFASSREVKVNVKSSSLSPLLYPSQLSAEGEGDNEDFELLDVHNQAKGSMNYTWASRNVGLEPEKKRSSTSFFRDRAPSPEFGDDEERDHDSACDSPRGQESDRDNIDLLRLRLKEKVRPPPHYLSKDLPLHHPRIAYSAHYNYFLRKEGRVPALHEVYEREMRMNTMEDEPDAPSIRIEPIRVEHANQAHSSAGAGGKAGQGRQEEGLPRWDFWYSNRLWHGDGVALPKWPTYPSTSISSSASTSRSYFHSSAAKHGCDCVGECKPTPSCSCYVRQRKWFESENIKGVRGWVYSAEGRLKVNDFPVWECGEWCGCDGDCRNRVGGYFITYLLSSYPVLYWF